MLEQLQEALHQRPHIPCPMGIPGSSRILVLAMLVLLRTCHSPILIRLTKLLVQEREIALLLGPLDLVVPLFGLGTGHWLAVLRSQTPRMGPLVGVYLITYTSIHGKITAAQLTATTRGDLTVSCFSMVMAISNPDGSARFGRCLCFLKRACFH